MRALDRLIIDCFNTTDAYNTNNILVLYVFSIPSILIQDVPLNGCEVSTFKKNKMNSSFDNIIKIRETSSDRFFYYLVRTLQSAWAYF
jgi:hypothetical protein